MILLSLSTISLVSQSNELLSNMRKKRKKYRKEKKSSGDHSTSYGPNHSSLTTVYYNRKRRSIVLPAVIVFFPKIAFVFFIFHSHYCLSTFVGREKEEEKKKIFSKITIYSYTKRTE